MIYYITTLPKYFPVSDIIRNALVEKTGKRILISRNPKAISRFGKIILNVGTTYPFVKDLAINSKVINLPITCAISGDKNRTYRMFKDYVNAIEIKYGFPTNYPVVKREDINSFHGKGIKLCNSSEDFGEFPGYYSDFINFNAEYRVFIAVYNGELKLQRVFRKDLKPEFEGQFVPKNAEHCKYYHISKPKISALPDFVDGIIQAMVNKGIYNFYFGLDVGRVERELILIETNSAPGMNSISIDAFTNLLIEEVLYG